MTINKDLMGLVKAIVSGDSVRVLEIVKASPDLVQQPSKIGASRQTASEYFFPEIKHYMYAGDTALHMASAGFRSEIGQILIDHGASCAARNRRGAQPLHYASDSNTWNPTAQVTIIQCLIRSGANPNATDIGGVAPIHRAVRTRGAGAVQALLLGGAKVDLKNKSGSTPLHLAVQNTGKGGSGSPEAIEEQRKIILLLLRNGASTRHKDGNGRTVDQAVKVPWVRELLERSTTRI
jgi:ankyrin repeat protein